jgi:predicted acylesterase/phospholipase RssA
VAKEKPSMKQAKTSTKPKRAITLGGGGPAAGLHIGVLKKLAEVQAPITFDVWALSCIGAWVGIIYNQCDKGNEADQTYEFFRNGVFRDDVSYSRFPINTVFGPDWYGNTRALIEFLANLDNYRNIWLPDRIMDSFRETAALLLQGRKWEDGEFTQWVLNNFMAVKSPIPFLDFNDVFIPY